ncbi:hypothetical protein FF098_013605 [Parvularcula flava]|nr:hypothetical protein [Aquisalinus luteolus]NHK28953.1 hypothetical protein [Aquisalinus luteolus]
MLDASPRTSPCYEIPDGGCLGVERSQPIDAVSYMFAYDPISNDKLEAFIGEARFVLLDDDQLLQLGLERPGASSVAYALTMCVGSYQYVPDGSLDPSSLDVLFLPDRNALLVASGVLAGPSAKPEDYARPVVIFTDTLVTKIYKEFSITE